jgi:SAM-dependent methyltransferase
MDIEELRRNWDGFGRQDPLWAVLTQDGMEGGGWDVESFFRRGAAAVDHAMSILESVHPSLAKGRALDFGCGVGRLTQGLCKHFQIVDGVDIAASMVDIARKANQHGDRCRYHVNTADNLALFEDDTFDLVFTIIVLQHIHPQYCKEYLNEFLRVLKPGGVLFFQLPDQYLAPGQRAARNQPQSICSDPLPDAVLRAEIRVQGGPLNLVVGEVREVPVVVRNLSSAVWPALARPDRKYMIRVGNHWLASNGTMRVHDDGRMALPMDIQPGQELSVTLPVTAPGETGDYLLEVDVVQEGHAWFGDKGSPTCRLPVQVVESGPSEPVPLSGSSPGEDRSEQSPRMEVYGAPPSQVVEYLESCGGRVLDVEEDDWAGPEYVSYHFTVTKD